MGNVVVDGCINKIVISNPGSMLVSIEEFYEGQHSVCRNPLIQKMFVLIGVGEKAGSGADVILKGWNDNNWKRPVISQHEDPERVEMTMELEEVRNDAQTRRRTHGDGKEMARSWQGVGVELKLDYRTLEKIYDFCKNPRTLAEIATHLGMADRYKMKKKYIDPMLGSYIRMTIPDKPNSPQQQYEAIPITD